MNFKFRVKSFLIGLALTVGLSSGICFPAFPGNQVLIESEQGEKVFIIHGPTDKLEEFRELAKQAARLKPYGRVQVNISRLAEKGFHEIPPGNNFWYEYASYNPTPFKFFPDSKIAPFLPVEFVRKNKVLLLSKAEILREFDLEAAFWCYEPNFLPEAFFKAYPHLRGPRIDHPRRSNHAAFAPCIDTEEVQDMYAGMVAELLNNVPEIKTFFFKTNDAGSGICWSDWLYSGSNGPSHCKDRSAGERIASLMNSFKKGAEKAGTNISIHLVGSMYTDEEEKDIHSNLPEGCFFQSPGVRNIGSGFGNTYPVMGIFNPLSIIGGSNALTNPDIHTLFISYRGAYDRGHDKISVNRLTDLLVRYLESPVQNGTEKELYDLCREWAGREGAEELAKAFIALQEAERFKSKVAPRVRSTYWGVSTRHMTRPLIFAPQMLAPEEESYFIPHVFNVSEEEARMDYTDIHGGNPAPPETGAMSGYISMLNDAIHAMEQIPENAPEYNYIMEMAKGWRIYSSIMRSCGNFSEAQVIRNRNAERLSQPPKRPAKTPTWEGDADLQAFNAVMRDELDNTAELIEILMNGGMNYVFHAEHPRYEDTFLPGPDLIEQLRMKMKIMVDHWTDIEGFLTSPYK